MVNELKQNYLSVRRGIMDKNNVNHPKHYTEGTIETWDFIASWRFCNLLGNVVKYISRAGKKNDEVEDLMKARSYLVKKMTIGDFLELPPMNSAAIDPRVYAEDIGINENRADILYWLCMYKRTKDKEFLEGALFNLEKEIEGVQKETKS